LRIEGIENWKLEIENWKLKIKNWKLKIKNWRTATILDPLIFNFKFSIFNFLQSSVLDLPPSIFHPRSSILYLVSSIFNPRSSIHDLPSSILNPLSSILIHISAPPSDRPWPRAGQVCSTPTKPRPQAARRSRRTWPGRSRSPRKADRPSIS